MRHLVHPLTRDVRGRQPHPDRPGGGQPAQIGRQLDRRHPPRQPQVERDRRHRVQRHQQAQRVPVGAVGQPLPARHHPAPGGGAGGEGQVRGVQPLLDHAHQRHAEARARGVDGHAEAVLLGRELNRLVRRPPRVRVVQQAQRDVRLDPDAVFLHESGPDLGHGPADAQRLDPCDGRARLGRLDERAADGRHVRMPAAGRALAGGPAQYGQEIAPVQPAAHAPLRVQGGAERAIPVRRHSGRFLKNPHMEYAPSAEPQIDIVNLTTSM